MNDLLEKYFQGTLTAEEQAEVDHLLKTDEAFKKEHAFQRQVRQAFIQQRRNQLKSLVKDLEKSSSVAWYRSKTWLSIAASVVLLVGIGMYFYQQDQSGYSEYFQPLPNMVAPTVRAGEATAGETTKAFQLYEREEYAEAIRLWEQQSSLNYKEIYMGISYLATKAPDKALEYLRKPIQNDSLSLDAYRQWYLALTYLELGDRREALDLLALLAQSPHPVQAQASQLLRKLE